MRNESNFAVEHGSIVYGTISNVSDVDVIIVVPDKYKEVLSNYENSIYEDNSTYDDLYGKWRDEQYICESDFIQRIKNYDVMALECIFTPQEHILRIKDSALSKYQNFFIFDRWGIRQSFSGTASNSWAKAHKKMTVEKDLDIYRGQKSLFHSLRILMMANQLCEFGYIKDFKEANDYWWDIYANELSWDEYKAKYKPIYNELRSKLAILAPKPVEK